MSVLIKILSIGLVATFFMTVFIKISSRTMSKDFYVPVILGNLLKLKSPSLKLIFGTVIHYAIGVALGTMCFYIWGHFPNSRFSFGVLITGIVYGIAAIVAWRIVLLPSQYILVKNTRDYLILIFFGHIVFAFTSWFMWLLLE